MNMQRTPLLVVEGNIGAGKSTFLRIVGAALQARLIYEPASEWQNVAGESLLHHFYADKHRWAYTFQTYAFLTRVRAQERNARHDKPTTILERSVYSDRYCFAQSHFELGTITPMEWQMYCELFEWFVEAHAPKPDAFIYLRTDPEVCLDRLHKRNRSEEVGVTLDYLRLIHDKHENLLVHRKGILPHLSSVPVLVLACNEDFEHNNQRRDAHVDAIVDFLWSQFQLPTHMTVSPPALL